MATRTIYGEPPTIDWLRRQSTAQCIVLLTGHLSIARRRFTDWNRKRLIEWVRCAAVRNTRLRDERLREQPVPAKEGEVLPPLEDERVAILVVQRRQRLIARRERRIRSEAPSPTWTAFTSFVAAVSWFKPTSASARSR